MGKQFSFRSISAWIFSHRTDNNSNGNGKSLAFCYKYPLAISRDCYSCLISIHSVYFQISVVWGLTLIQRQWTHSANREHALFHGSSVLNASPAPRAGQVESCVVLFSTSCIWWHTRDRLGQVLEVQTSCWCHNEVMGSWRGRERLDWKCEWRILNPY